MQRIGSTTRGKGEQTRHAIIEKALSHASMVGLDGISIGGLAKDMGLSKSGLFSHFESKENLQLQVLQTARRHFIELVVTPAIREPRGEPRVRALFEHWLRWFRSPYVPGGCIFTSSAAELDDRPGILRDYLVECQTEWIGVMVKAVRIAIEEGHFREDLDLDQVAYDLYSLMLAYQHYRSLLRDPRAEQRARRAFDRLTESCRSTP